MIALLSALIFGAGPAFSCPKGTTLRTQDIEKACLDKNGAEHGPLEARTEDGVVLREARYAHGKLESDAWWRLDGKPKSAKAWSAGMRQGEWNVFYENGKIAWRRLYEMDRLVRETLYDDSGVERKQPVKLADGGFGEGGGLSKNLLALVIHNHGNEVKFCYEQQLIKDKTLGGKVAVFFLIDATGSVARVEQRESTLKNAAVEECIRARIKRWEFPRPLGGGDVTVTFPWILQPAPEEEED